jgi:hypothetical protein
MTPQERLASMLQTPEPGRALRALVLELSTEGYTKAKIYEFLEQLLLELRTRADHRETDEDAVLDTLDALTGCCHPDARLLPDQHT